MGSSGSTQRRAHYRSHSASSYRYDETPRSHHVSRVGSEHNVAPRIVVHSTPYIDRLDAYEVKQRLSARSQTYADTPKRSPSTHSRTSMPQTYAYTPGTSSQCIAPAPQLQAPQTPVRHAYNQATSSEFIPPAPPPQPSQTPLRYGCTQATSSQFLSPASPSPPPMRQPTVEQCSCRICTENKEALAAYTAASSAATSTYIAPQSMQCPPARAMQTRATTAITTPTSTCTGGGGGARGNQVQSATAIYSDPQRTTSIRSLSRTCGAPNCKGHFDCSGDRPANRSYSNRHIPDTSTPIRQASIAAQTQTPQNSKPCYGEVALASGGPTSDVVSDFHHECLEAHNRYRARHQNCPPLSLSDELSRYAQQWAKHLAVSGRLEHRQVHTYGENLYTSRGMEVNGSTAVQSWYDEVRYYDFSKPNYKPGTGHFTQVIWRESRQLGVGIATRGDTTYVVCNYNPPGNIIGTFDTMVPPLK